MTKITAKAPHRRRPRRIQKKIKKRYGYLHHFGHLEYINTVHLPALADSLAGLTEAMMVASKAHCELGREMTDIIIEANQRG